MTKQLQNLFRKIIAISIGFNILSSPIFAYWSSSVSGEWATQLKKDTSTPFVTEDIFSLALQMSYEPHFFSKNGDISCETVIVYEPPHSYFEKNCVKNKKNPNVLFSVSLGYQWKDEIGKVPSFYGFIRTTPFDLSVDKENRKYFSSLTIGGEIYKEFDPILIGCSFIINPPKQLHFAEGKTLLSIGPVFSLQPKFIFQITPEVSCFGLIKWTMKTASKINEALFIAPHTHPEIGVGVHFKHNNSNSSCIRFRADTLHIGSNALSLQCNTTTKF